MIYKRVIMALLIFTVSTQLALLCHAAADIPEHFVRGELTEVYSAQDAAFLQWFSDGYSFKTSVPQGQVSPGLVSADFPSELKWSLERDGEPMEYNSGDYLFQQGKYTFTVLTPNDIYAEFSFAVSELGARETAANNSETVTLTHRYLDGMFVYTFENGKGFSANVPNGGITNYDVRLNTDSELICILTRNGSAIRHESGGAITEDGYYHMVITTLSDAGVPDLSGIMDASEPSSFSMADLEREAANYSFSESELAGLTIGSIHRTVFSFQIVTRPTRDIAVFNAPIGFELASVFLGGEYTEPADKAWHRFDRDGDYIITLTDTVSSAPDQVVRLSVRRLPPPVRLEGAVNGFSAPPPVSVIADEGVSIRVLRNGMEITPQAQYKEPGRYIIMAEDEAGNTARFSFDITRALPASLILLILLCVLVVCVIYVVYARRTMSVE
ncbi:MAG: hypothetical protein FWH02_04650 [Oscillospiraceae bacterium]|nr:hypothetical protein [Oscillospiraceae bacterium]